jgi:hypothetical protein
VARLEGHSGWHQDRDFLAVLDRPPLFVAQGAAGDVSYSAHTAAAIDPYTSDIYFAKGNRIE